MLDCGAQQTVPRLTQPQARRIDRSCWGRRQPEPLPLERIGWQFHQPRTPAGVHRPPVHPHPSNMGLARRHPKPPQAAIVASQRGHHHHVLRGGSRLACPGLLNCIEQQRMRTGLHKHPVPLRARGPYCLRKLHRLANAAKPISAIQFRGIHQPAGDRREERRRTRPRLDAGQCLYQRTSDRIDLSRMRRIVDLDAASPNTLGLSEV
ncbi:hypothetical protein DAVIS_02358 [Mycobacterium marinum]|uniref:Uncharacterized protein n=1 Tax=Mycobacterium marinum TaxID=1781 RepID=A0A3E2MWR9_MYCMR|nr:hypothetical protein DAVIS_02358 [Mycobacterium marinum]